MHDPYQALYIHVPFCKQRCRYCDFEADAVSPDDPFIQRYAEGVVKDIRDAGRSGELSEIKTVYIGGGTPTYVSRVLTQLLYTLSLSMTLDSSVECSVEANPDSLTPALVRDMWALGVNRLSVGVQSFFDNELEALGRIHDAQAARNAIAAARERFDNVSIDVMCGIPGQSLETFLKSVEEAVSLGITHISIYPLSIEQGTDFYRCVNRGKMALPDPDFQAECMVQAASFLASCGFLRYEVASYAQAGYECRHNIAYWTGVPYMGLGPSAVTMTQNASRRMRKQHDQIIDDLDQQQMRAEDLMLRMRMTAGVPDRMVADARELLPDLPAVLDDLAQKGLVSHTQGAWRPTEQGWLCGNDLYGALFDLAP